MSNYSHLDLVFKEIAIVAGSLSSKRKYQPMRDSLNAFYNYVDQNKKQNPLKIPHIEMQKILKPALAYKSAKFHIALISFVIKMVNLKVICDIYTFNDILGYFIVVKEIQKDSLAVKLSQSFMNLIQPEYVHFGNLSFVENCLNIGLFMKNSKLQIISSTSNAIVQKIIELLSLSTQLIIGAEENGSPLEDLYLEVDLSNKQTVLLAPNTKHPIETTIEEAKQPSLKPALSEKKQDQLNNLTKILHDFIIISDFRRPPWYPVSVPVDREIGLSSINILFKNMGRFFQAYEQIDNLIRNNLFTVLKKIISTPSTLIKHSMIIESFKCVANVIEMGPLTYMDYWRYIDQQIRIPDHSIQKNLALQTIIYFTDKQILLECLAKAGDKNTFFYDLIVRLSIWGKETQAPTEIETKKWEQINPVSSLIADSNDDCLPSDNYYVLRSLCEFQQKFSQSLAVMSEQSDIPLIAKVKNIKSPQMLTYISVVEKICRPCIRGQKYLLEKDLEEGIIQNILNAIQNFVNITGCIQLRQAQEAFIKMICEFCLPKNTQVEFSKKHIQINKMVLNIANCLGNLLECSCWISILKTFQQCENFYQRNRLARDGSQEEQIKSQDILILFASLDQLFSHSRNYENEHLLLIMDAINQMTIEQLESNQHDSPTSQVRMFDNQRPKLFSLTKLVELVKANLHRLDLFWELIMAHFICVVSSKNLQIVNNAADTLCQIIFIGFEYMLQFHQKLALQNKNETHEEINACVKFVKEKWSAKDGAYQHTLLQPLLDLCPLRSTELKDTILQAILKVLQNNGHELRKLGWDQILLVLKYISSEQTHIYVKQGLTATECIINQFLIGLTSEQMENLFEIIQNFKQNSSDHTINFQICNMLWQIGDFLNKSSKEKHDEFMGKIFDKLASISLDSVPEIRHSAIHIFTNLVLHLSNDKNSWEDWKRILEDIFFNMSERIILQFQDKRVGNEQDQIQWEETAKTIMQSALKLTKKYFSVIEEKMKDNQELISTEIQDILNKLLPQIVLSMKQIQGELLLECSRILKEILQCRPKEHFIHNQAFIEVLQFFERLFTTPPSNVKILKVVIIKVIPEVLSFIELAFKTSADFQNDTQITQLLFSIYQKIISFPAVADMTFNLITSKIFYDESNSVNTIKVFNSILQKLNETSFEMLVNTIQQILSINPLNKASNNLLLKFLPQLEELLCQSGWKENSFLQVIQNIFDTVLAIKSNIAYTQMNFTGRSIWCQGSFTLLNVAKNNRLPQNLNKILVKLLPKYENNLPEQYINENIAITNAFVDYLASQELQNENEFFQNLYELSICRNNQFAIGEIPLKTLFKCVDSKKSKVCLPYLIATSQKLMDQFFAQIHDPTPKLFLLLLEKIRDTDIPQQSFITFKSIFSDQIIEFDLQSPLQSTKGHICFLLPQLIKCIASGDLEVRKLTQQSLNHISDQILKQKSKN